MVSNDNELGTDSATTIALNNNNVALQGITIERTLSTSAIAINCW